MKNHDGVICLLSCISLVPGLKRKVVSRVAFAPPRPSGYNIRNGQIYIAQIPIPQDDTTKSCQIRIQTILLKLANGVPDMPCLYFTNPKAKSTIVYSHGNATDLGYMFPQYLAICQFIEVNLLAYEYSGYGPHVLNTKHQQLQPSEELIYLNIEAAIDFLVLCRNVNMKRIILYGQSLGTAPSTYIAMKHRDIGGMILHSGIKSGLTVLLPGHNEKLPWCDAFRNLDRMRLTTVPTFIIHGMNDRDVSLSHGVALYEAARGYKDAWWVPNAGHNDIELRHRKEYFRRLSLFLIQQKLVDYKGTCLTSGNVSVDSERITPAIVVYEPNNDGVNLLSPSSSDDDALLIDPPGFLTHKTKEDVDRRHGNSLRVIGSTEVESVTSCLSTIDKLNLNASALLSKKSDSRTVNSETLDLFECRCDLGK